MQSQSRSTSSRSIPKAGRVLSTGTSGWGLQNEMAASDLGFKTVAKVSQIRASFPSSSARRTRKVAPPAR